MYIVHVVCISARYVYCTCGVYICTLFTLYMWCVYLHVYVHCTCRVYICMLCILYMWCVYLHVMYIVHVVCISACYVYCTCGVYICTLCILYNVHVVCISARYVHCTCGVYICTLCTLYMWCVYLHVYVLSAKYHFIRFYSNKGSKRRGFWLALDILVYLNASTNLAFSIHTVFRSAFLSRQKF